MEPVVDAHGTDTHGNECPNEIPHPGRDGRGGSKGWLAPLRGAGCHGDRFPVVSLRSTTGYTPRNPRFRDGAHEVGSKGPFFDEGAMVSVLYSWDLLGIRTSKDTGP